MLLIKRPSEFKVEELRWGRLIWQVSASLGNSERLTVGRCFINPGQQNRRHYHPNCDEVLSVLSGTIVHTWNDVEVEMSVGDVISIPSGIIHNARNTGTEICELAISFSSAYRSVVDCS